MKELSLEDKAQRYDEAIKVAKSKIKNDKNHVLYEDDIIEIFPELKESKDEKIRKEIINYFECQSRDEPERKGIHNRWIDWVEKQGEQKPLYIRFGDVPSNETSKIYRGEVEIGEEKGVSVYPAFEVNGNIVLGLTLPITKSTLYTQQHLLEYDNRPCYLVSGDYVGEGTDGEPLIRNISIIKRLDNYRIKESEKQGEQKPPVIDFNTNDWYVSKVDGKIHDMTYNPADKVEPNKKNNMKVFGCNAQLPYSGGGILVAANDLDEAFETAARKYDRLFYCLRQENGHIIPTSIDEAELITSDLYPKDKWEEITELTCNCDKPHVIIENGYES